MSPFDMAKAVQQKLNPSLPRPTEAQDQQAIVAWLQLAYPGVLVHADVLSALPLRTMAAKSKVKKMGGNAGWPDLFIAKPTALYHGLFVELKRKGEHPIVMSRKTKAPAWRDEHVECQAQVLARLRDQNYHADFAVGFDDAVGMIEKYLRGEMFSFLETVTLANHG